MRAYPRHFCLISEYFKDIDVESVNMPGVEHVNICLVSGCKEHEDPNQRSPAADLWVFGEHVGRKLTVKELRIFLKS